MDCSEVSMQSLLSPQILNITKGVCYLDHAGATLYPTSLIESFSRDLCSNLYGNPHSNSLSSSLTSDTIDQIRYKVLQHFNTDTTDYSVVFTSGATEALRIVAESFDFTGTDQPENETEYTVRYNGNSGEFVYMQDNHTSVLGMRSSRNITNNASNPVQVHCITHDEAFSIFGKEHKLQSDTSHTIYNGNSLFVYSAQCNFSGVKYPLSWIEKTKHGLLQRDHTRTSRWFCFLDAASFVSTNPLDLSSVKPDFICISFYKIFGFPTGLGALLVKNSSAHVLNKDYYGGGTVLIALSSKPYHVLRPVLHDRFEDGTLNFLSIIALNHCFSTFKNLGLTMDKISLHCFSLAKYAYNQLLQLHHANGTPAVVLYNDTDYEDQSIQGGIVTFNMVRHSGEYIGFAEVLNMANLYGIHLRSGCFCNPGACQRHLGLTDEQLCFNFQAGHVCGDDKDLINGLPTGAVRASFGYYSTKSDVDVLVDMLTDCFVTKPYIRKIPENFNKKRELLRNKFDDVTVNCSVPIKRTTGTEVLHPQVEKPVDTRESHIYKQITSPDSQLTLSHIFVYPIKSCGYFSAPQWPLNRRGLLYDREWMVVTETSVAVTQKQEPRLCRVRPIIDLQQKLLRLTAEGFADCTIELELQGNVSSLNEASLCQSKVCGDQVKGVDCGDEVASWLCAVIGRQGLRLFRQQARTKRKIANGAVNTIESLSLSNQAQFLLISETSVSWLSSQLHDNSDCLKESMLHRFRSNFVVTGVTEPFEEKSWTDILIGDTPFKVDGPCNRCQMICIDQTTGKKTKEPLTTLTASLQEKMKFGIYLSQRSAPDSDCMIKTGDICKPLKHYICNSV